MLRSIQKCDEGSDMQNDLKMTLEYVDELGRLKLANVLAKQPTLVHRSWVTASEVVGLEVVDVVEVLKLVAAIQPSWIPSTRKGMTRVHKSHGLALIGYCLTMTIGHCDACLMLVLGHPTPLVMRTLFQPRLRSVVLAWTMRTLPICCPQILLDLPMMVDAYLSPHQACPPHL